MRVLLINHFPLQGSGSGIYTMNIAQELIKEGHEVFVIDIDNQIEKMKFPFRTRTIICDSTKNENYDLPFNFPCFTTHPRSLNTYYNLNDDQIKEYIDCFVRITNEVIAEWKPDVIHAQHLWITPYVAYKSGVPYVITAHGTDLMGFKNDKRYHQYAIKGAENAHRIITISRQVHNDTLDLYKLPEDKLKLNPNGFDTDIFKIKDTDKDDFFQKNKISSQSDTIVSFVGKFTDFKGIDTLIKAAPKITAEIPDIVFALAGNGVLMEKMVQLRDEFNLKNIYFLGHQSQIDVSTLYNLAQVSVVPSRIEPFGLVAIEALACGTPVVATNAGGLPDFINEEVGQLVQMEKPDLLAEAIISEIKNKTKDTKGKYAAEYAVENYSWAKTLHNVIALYEKAVKG